MPADLLQSEVEVPRFENQVPLCRDKTRPLSVPLAGLELRELSPKC